MYSTVTFEGNLAADVEVKENKSGGVYVDAVVLVNQGKDSNGDDRTPSRWQTRMTGRIAENAANLRKGDPGRGWRNGSRRSACRSRSR